MLPNAFARKTLFQMLQMSSVNCTWTGPWVVQSALRIPAVPWRATWARPWTRPRVCWTGSTYRRCHNHHHSRHCSWTHRTLTDRPDPRSLAKSYTPPTNPTTLLLAFIHSWNAKLAEKSSFLSVEAQRTNGYCTDTFNLVQFFYWKLTE